MDDSEIFAQIQKLKGGQKGIVTSSLQPSKISMPIPHPSGQIIVKEMFMHTTMKIYPNGSIYLTITGRPKDVEYKHKIKQPEKIVEKLDKYVKNDGVESM